MTEGFLCPYYEAKAHFQQALNFARIHLQMALNVAVMMNR